MAGTAQDVEAGRAFVTLTLRRADYDKQVDDLKRDEGADRPSGAVASTAEAGHEFNIAKALARGAAFKAGSVALTKLIPLFRETTTVALVAAPAVASVGVAAAGTAPALAATGVAAGGAATGFSAIVAAAAPVLIPLAAIAAAAGLVYVSLFKWDELPVIVKALMLALFPLVVSIRAVVFAFKMLKVAVAVVTAPFRLAAKAVRGFFDAITAIPRVISATIGHIRRLAAAAGKMAVKVIQAAAEMSAKVAKSAVEIAKSATSIPGNLARNTSVALKNVGTSITRIGAIAAGISGAIVGAATLAARSWSRYGERIRGVQNDLLRFNLTAEEAAIIARVSDQTGESMERLARDMRDGTRDFSRWRNEMRLSGTLMSGAGLSSALALSRAYSSLKGSVVGLKNTIASALGPTLTESAELFTGMVRGVTRWVSQNKPLVVQIFKVASTVGIAAGVITTLGGAIAGAGTVVSPFVAGLTLLAGVMAAVEIRTEAGRSLWASYGGAVRRVVGIVIQNLGQMAAFADRVIGGVADALIAGDLALAVDVMWAGAKVAWISALLEIDSLTSGVFGGIIQSLAAGKWAAAGEAAMNALRQAWLTGVGFLTGIWDRVVDAADTAWTGILTGFDRVVAGMKLGLGEFYNWAVANVFNKLAAEASKIPGVDVAFGTQIDLTPDEVADREGPLAERQAARQAASDEARTAREREIEDLRRRQAELAKQSGEAAEQEQTANQKALKDALAAAAAAREAAAENKLREEDFAVSRDVQSIARFSGEALGLSVGRGETAAEKTAKLTADQLKETKGLRKDIQENTRETHRLVSMGGFT